MKTENLIYISIENQLLGAIKEKNGGKLLTEEAGARCSLLLFNLKR